MPAPVAAHGPRIDPAVDVVPAGLVDLLLTDEGAIAAPSATASGRQCCPGRSDRRPARRGRLMASVARQPAAGVTHRLTVARRAIALLRAFLERDRLRAAYALCDLDPREFGRTRWGIAQRGGETSPSCSSTPA
jgi:hypothetical protein